MDCASVQPKGATDEEEEKGRQVLTVCRGSQDSRRIPRHEWAEKFLKSSVDDPRERHHSSRIQFE
jgi:hypothetical protein